MDYDAGGWMDLFLASGAEAGGWLYRNLGDGRFDDATSSSGIRLPAPAIGGTSGDYDHDGLADLAVGTTAGVALLRNSGGGAFEDATLLAGVGPAARDFPLGLTFIDFDHDGDLDLYVVRSADFPVPGGVAPIELSGEGTAPGNLLWRNNGNGTFTDWTAAAGLGGSRRAIAAVGADLNNDRAIDVVVTGWDGSPEIFLNSREGPFDTLAWTEDFQAPAAGVVVADFDKDTWMDLAFMHWGAPGLSMWRNVAGDRFDSLAGVEPGMGSCGGRLRQRRVDGSGSARRRSLRPLYPARRELHALWRHNGPCFWSGRYVRCLRIGRRSGSGLRPGRPARARNRLGEGLLLLRRRLRQGHGFLRSPRLYSGAAALPYRGALSLRLRPRLSARGGVSPLSDRKECTP